MIVTRGDAEVLRTLQLGEGDLWALAAVFIWAWQVFLMRWKQTSTYAFMTTIALIVIGITPFYLYEHATVGPMPVTQNLCSDVAVIASFIGTTCWNEHLSIRRAGGIFPQPVLHLRQRDGDRHPGRRPVLVSHRGRRQHAGRHLAGDVPAQVHLKPGTGNG